MTRISLELQPTHETPQLPDLDMEVGQGASQHVEFRAQNRPYILALVLSVSSKMCCMGLIKVKHVWSTTSNFGVPFLSGQ